MKIRSINWISRLIGFVFAFSLLGRFYPQDIKDLGTLWSFIYIVVCTDVLGRIVDIFVFFRWAGLLWCAFIMGLISVEGWNFSMQIIPAESWSVISLHPIRFIAVVIIGFLFLNAVATCFSDTKTIDDIKFKSIH